VTAIDRHRRRTPVLPAARSGGAARWRACYGNIGTSLGGDGFPSGRARPRAESNSVRRVASCGAWQWLRCSRGVTQESCMIDYSKTGSFQIGLPKDLVSESRRQPKPKDDELKVEAWRSSWFSKVSEMLVGKD
jgi:hypothetical protein